MFSAVNRGWLKGRWGLKLVGFRFFQILNATALDGVVAYINQKGCKHIITMSGAGISTCKYQYFCVYLESMSYARLNLMQVQEFQIFAHLALACTTICKSTTCRVRKPFFTCPFSAKTQNRSSCWPKSFSRGDSSPRRAIISFACCTKITCC